MTKKQAPKKQPNKFDGISLTELEASIEKLHSMSRESQKEMYETLEYLRTSGRFRENYRYKKANFWTYLEDRFTIREGTYRENAIAFLKYPKPAIEYGVGLITKIGRVCGRANTAKVLSEIEKEGASRKAQLPRAKIENIIHKYAVVKPEKKIVDWKAMYEAESAAHAKTKDALRDAMKTIAELKEQVEKLKKTAEKVGMIKGIMDKQSMPVECASA